MIPTDKWMPADGLTLEPNALAAAKEIERNLALTAGPGAGKTEMLAQRADFLLRTGVCRYPKRILAISFKVDASKNLKERVRQRCGPDLAARFDSHTFHAFAKRIIDRFRLVLVGTDALDEDYTIGQQRIQRKAIAFTDMVPLATQILENSAIARRAVRQTYSHVFLDEFQDCTDVQYAFIQVAFQDTSSHLTAVGDTKQRIMAWAGALEGIFSTFAKDFGAKPLNLYQNFRSEPRLRRMQNEMVKEMDPGAAVDDDELTGDAGEIQICEYRDDDEEASALATQIYSWISEEGIEPSEIAVLVSREQRFFCFKLFAALELLGVPYRSEDSLQDLTSEPLPALIVDFLLIVVGEREPAAYSRLLNFILFDSSGDEEREHQSRSKWDRFVSRTKQRIVAGEIDLGTVNNLKTLVDELINTIGREAVIGLSSDYERGPRFTELIDQTVLRIAELLAGTEAPATALAGFSGDQAVKIMSIHKSKGLEWDSVVILGVETQTFWGDPDEQRSAFFVGISRAKRRLLLTVTERREKPAGFPRGWNVNRAEHDEFVGYARNAA